MILVTWELHNIVRSAKIIDPIYVVFDIKSEIFCTKQKPHHNCIDMLQAAISHETILAIFGLQNCQLFSICNLLGKKSKYTKT